VVGVVATRAVDVGGRGRANVGFAAEETMLIGFHCGCDDSSVESLLLVMAGVDGVIMGLRRMRGCLVLRARPVSAVRVPWLEAAESSSSTRLRFLDW
jgi:hypothetical protein